MRVKSMYDQTVDVPGIGLVEPGQIIDVDRTTGKSLAASAMWRVTSKDKDDDDDDETADAGEEEEEE